MSARLVIAALAATALLSTLVVGTGAPMVFAGGPAEAVRTSGHELDRATKGRKPATASATPTPTPTPTATATPTASSTGTPTGTPTTPVSPPSPSEPTSAASASASTLLVSCPLDVTATYAGSTYCRGSLADVVTGRYGAGVRVLVSGVTVYGVSSGVIDVSGASACPSDPSGQPTYCGQTLWGLTVATNEMTTVPVVGEMVDLYGVTGPNGTFSATGFIHVGWCVLDWGDC